jgi:hypothetical protein
MGNFDNKNKTPQSNQGNQDNKAGQNPSGQQNQPGQNQTGQDKTGNQPGGNMPGQGSREQQTSGPDNQNKNQR